MIENYGVQVYKNVTLLHIKYIVYMQMVKSSMNVQI